MTGKRGGLGPTAGMGPQNARDRVRAPQLILGLLFGAVLLAFSGCEERIRPAPPAPITATSDPTEAQLLAELNKKYENPQVHLELARLYHKAQNWLKAEDYYNNAIGFDPANRAAQAGLVKLFLDRGNPSKAEQFANAYIGQAGRTSVRETLRLGWEFKQLKLDDYTLRCFRQALAADPNSYEANKQMGFYYFEKGDNAQAKQYLMRSFDLYPRQPDVAGALGKLGVVVELPPEPPQTVPAKPK